MFIYYFVIALCLICDQVIKGLTVQYIPLSSQMPLIPHVLSLQYIKNTGAAWGVLAGKMQLFYIITIVVVVAFFVLLHQEGKKSRLLGFALSFLIGGALGNFIDRLRLQYVVDMFRFDFIDFPIFNFADACLTIGVILLLIYILFFERKSGKRYGT